MHRSPLRSLLSLILTTSLLATSIPGTAAGSAKDASVLGLESEDAEASKKLTEALRKAFSARGVGGGQELPLVELKLTMGCEEDAVDCLAEGGKTLGVDKLVYGHLRPAAGGGYSIDLQMLDVGTATIERDVSMEVGVEDLEDDAIGQTAESIVARMYDEEAAPLPSVGEAMTEPEPTDAPPDQGGKLVWGKQDPTPIWKWVGLGVSAGLAAASVGTAIGTSLAIRRDGPVYNEMIEAAEDSLTDGKESNDIDPNSDADLCEEARRHPAGDPDPDTVTNAAVTKVCNKADALAKTATATWVTTGIFAASVVAFTVLIYVHREEPQASALRRRGLSLGVAPTTDGGFVVGGGMRF
jgi:hypothetical protein